MLSKAVIAIWGSGNIGIIFFLVKGMCHRRENIFFCVFMYKK